MLQLSRLAHRLLPAAVLTMSLATQDMIGALSTGEVVRLDSVTGAVTPLAIGLPGKNALACTSDNRLWTTVRSGSILNPQFHLAVIDPFTGAESLPFGTSNVGDIRALAGSRTGQLFGIRDVAGSDELVRIDLTTGAVTVQGPTGFSGIQALDFTGAGLRAWDLTAGLLLINSSSGLATDPFPSIGGPAGMQYLATDPVTEQSYVGRGTMHRLNTIAGTTGTSVTFAGSPELRGVEFTTGRQQIIGQPCAAANGLANCGVQNTIAAGQLLNVQSINHQATAIGIQIVGFSETAYAGLPLPIAMDPVFGTSGCFLRVSADFTLLGLSDINGVMVIGINLPPAVAFQQFYVQHAVLEAVPGGISFSNGLRIRPRL